MNTGFTLIEVLIAICVLSIVVSVALESHITAINLEHAARLKQTVRFEIDRVLAEALFDQLGTNTPSSMTADCDIHRSLMQIEKDSDLFKGLNASEHHLMETGSTELIQWEIVPKNRPSLKTVVFTHPFQQ